MRYKKTVIVGACVVSTLVVQLTMVNNVLEENSGKDKAVHQVGYAHLVSTAIAQVRETGTSPPKKSERATEEKKTQKMQKDTPAQPKKKTTPLDDFVPSEKIDADNAVDFPADI